MKLGPMTGLSLEDPSSIFLISSKNDSCLKLLLKIPVGGLRQSGGERDVMGLCPEDGKQVRYWNVRLNQYPKECNMSVLEGSA